MSVKKKAVTENKKPEVLSREHLPVNLTYLQHYQAMLDSESTIIGLSKYLKKYIITLDSLRSFVSDNHLVVTIGQEDPFKDVATEVWQQRRILQGKGRFVFVE